jgi:hypothetical protein
MLSCTWALWRVALPSDICAANTAGPDRDPCRRFEFGMVHAIVLSPYQPICGGSLPCKIYNPYITIPSGASSPQYTWLAADLASVCLPVATTPHITLVSADGRTRCSMSYSCSRSDFCSQRSRIGVCILSCAGQPDRDSLDHRLLPQPLVHVVGQLQA